MNKILIIFTLILSVFIYVNTIPIMTYAGHETCIDGSDNAYCGVTMDWEYIFSEVSSPEDTDTNLNDYNSRKYRNLYQGIDLIFDGQTEQALTGESMPTTDEDAGPYGYGGAYTDVLGYPEYRYEIHGWGEDEIRIDDGETSKEVVQDIYQPSWSKNTDDSLNIFKADLATTSVKIPEGTNIKVNLYNDGDRSPSDKVATATYNSADYQNGDTKNVRSTNIEFTGDYNAVYWVEAVLERDSADIESPVLGNNTVLTRELPEYRLTSEPYKQPPNNLLSKYNNHMIEEYNDEYGDTDEDAYSPRIDDFASAETSSYNFDSNTKVFHNAYSKISYVNDSIIASENYEDMDESRLGSIIPKEGEINVIYDSAISEPPNDGDWIYDDGVDEDDPDDGDYRWEYERDDIEYEIEVGATERVDDVSTFDTEIDTVQKDQSGSVTIDYSEDDYNADQIISLYSLINSEVEYDVNYEDYVIEWEDCPDDDSDEDEDYEDWVDEDDCDSPSDEYIDDEYWENYVGVPSGYDECLELALSDSYISQNPSCDGETLDVADYDIKDRYKVIDTETTDKIDEDKFDTYTGYTPDRVKTRVHKDEGTIWTDLESKEFSIKDTIFVNSDSSISESIQVPDLKGIPDGEGSEETYTVGEDEYNLKIPDNKILENEITDSEEVYMDIYTTGSSDSSDNIDIAVNEDSVYSGPIGLEQENNLEFNTIDENIDITSQVRDDTEINLDFDTDSSEDVRIDYVIKIKTDGSINKLDSRWNFATFRNSNWDHIYQYDTPCTSDNCLNYSAHGHVIINDGSRSLPDDTKKPSDVGLNYPSRTIPVYAYLVPTSRSIETGITSGYQENMQVYPETSISSGYNSLEEDSRYPEDFYLDPTNPKESIDDIGEGIEGQSYKGKIYSEYCPYQIGASDVDITKDQYCGFVTAYSADIYNEINLYDRQTDILEDIDFDSYVEAYESAEEQDVDDEDVVEGVEAFESPYQYSEYSDLNYGHLSSGTALGEDYSTRDSNRYYPEYTKFTIETDGSSGWSVSGKSSLSETQLESEKEYIFDSIDINIKKINDISGHFEERDVNREDIESQDTNHKFIDTSDYDSVPEDTDISQLKITITDQNNEPIDFESRKESSYDLKHQILVSRSGYTTDWTDQRYTPNENGTLYVGVKSEGDTNVEFIGDDEGDWWTKDENIRLLESTTKDTTSLDAEENKVEGTTGFPWRFIVFVIFVLSVVVSAVFRATGAEYTVRDIFMMIFNLFNPANDGFPFSDFIIKFIEFMLILFVIIAMTGSSNPFTLMEPFAQMFDQIVSALLS